MSVFQWFERLLKMFDYTVGGPIYFGIAKLIVETANLFDLFRACFDIL